MSKFSKLKIVLIIAALGLIVVAVLGTYWFLLLRKAHSTFENYYAFRGCAQLLEKTPDYGTCRTATGQVIKLVKYQDRWFLEGDGPGIW